MPNSTLDALISSVHTEISTRTGRTAPFRQERPHEAATYAWGSSLDFSAMGNAGLFVGAGWCNPEPKHCWTNGTKAELHLPVLPMEGTDLILTARLSPLVSPKTTAQLVRVSLNGAPTGQWLVRSPGLQHVIVFERHFAGRNRLTLQFDLPRAFSPQAHGMSADPRVLALAFFSLSLRPVNNPSSLLSA